MNENECAKAWKVIGMKEFFRISRFAHFKRLRDQPTDMASYRSARTHLKSKSSIFGTITTYNVLLKLQSLDSKTISLAIQSPTQIRARSKDFQVGAGIPFATEHGSATVAASIWSTFWRATTSASSFVNFFKDCYQINWRGPSLWILGGGSLKVDIRWRTFS